MGKSFKGVRAMDESTVKLMTVFCHAIAVTLMLGTWLWFSDFLGIKKPQPTFTSEEVSPWRFAASNDLGF
ncbi:MAG: hypothetical protein HC768_23425 [Acaryochloris sp. CRU_2_0]|nr:hypothetical protein [Acaryochloris sp. CRU_2_0]